jgi:hypothetical protein
MGKLKIVWYFITNYNIQIKNNYSTETQIFFGYFIINNNVQIKKKIYI